VDEDERILSRLPPDSLNPSVYFQTLQAGTAKGKDLSIHDNQPMCA
jgi:hypothetical protein